MGKSRKILLHNTGHYAIVDADDYENIMAFGKWYENDQGYAVKRIKSVDKKITLRMHALINDTPKGLVTDHINGDKLDNRKKNLRSVGVMINCWNSRKVDNHSKYNLPKGVTYDKERNRYVGCKTIRRRFDTLKEAMDFVKESERLYDRKA